MPPSPPQLTLHELRKRGLLQALAKAFDNRHDADELLEAVAYPQERRPLFAHAPNALAYWADICDGIDKGVTPCGLEALLRAVKTLRPSLALEVPAEAVTPTDAARGTPAASLSAREKH